MLAPQDHGRPERDAKSLQSKAKAHLHDIWRAETRAEAIVAFDFFAETYSVKLDRASAKLVKHRDTLLTV